MSEESITLQSTADNIFDPKIILNYCKGKTRFEVICLKQGSVSFIHGNVINFLQIRHTVKRFKQRF